MYLRGVNSAKTQVIGLENWIHRSTRFINQMQQSINQINIQQSSTKCTSQSTRFNNQICQSINQADEKKNKTTLFELQNIRLQPKIRIRTKAVGALTGV